MRGSRDGYRFERLVSVAASTVEDANRLIPQLKPAWSPVTTEGLVDLVGSPSRVYVARHGERVVGIAVLVSHRHLAGLRYHVEDVVVDEAHRRRDVARRLLAHAMGDVPGDVRSFDLRSHPTRVPAHRLYASLGFRAADTTVFRLDTSAHIADAASSGGRPPGDPPA